MNTAQAIYELVNQLPEDQVELVWLFAQSLQQQDQAHQEAHKIPAGTLTGLRGIAKEPASPSTDDELRNDYTEYLIQKYQ